MDAGGRAGAGGFDYQHRVAAWFAVRVLAGAAAPSVVELWAGSLSRVDCETGEPVDDARVVPVQGPVLVVQAKRTITLSGTAGSELAKTMDQFVSQHLLDGHTRDRLVLVIGPDGSGRVRRDLAAVLRKVRGAGEGTAVEDLPFSGAETRAYRILAGHVDRAWLARNGGTPSDGERRRLLRQCYVLVLDVEPDGVDEREARQLLRTAVVADPQRADSAWQAILERYARLAADGSGADQRQLQEMLTSRGVALRTVLDYHPDVARLAAATGNALGSLEASLTTIPGPGRQRIAVRRSSVEALVQRGQDESFLLVGEPGIGKTVAMHDLAKRATQGSKPVLFLPVGTIAGASLGELRNELGLQHDLIEVLEQWSPGTGGIVVIDALDAARNDPQADLWRSVIDAVRVRFPSWRVVASVRTWDLNHSPRLNAQFAGHVIHLDDLEDGELAQVAAAWPELGVLLHTAPEDLLTLLRNPFNLRLAAELLLSGTPVGELRQVRDRLELLHRYWEQRVSDQPGGYARHELLTRVCDYAVRHRVLTVPVSQILTGDTAAAEHLEVLLSRSVLAESAALPGGPATGPVRFAHHVLFDYAVAVTIFAAITTALQVRLRDDPDLVLFARPSIDMHLERLWAAGPSGFFEVGLAIVADPALPRLATVAVAEAAARRTVRAADLEALLDPIIAGNASPGAERLLRYLAVAVVIDRDDAVQPDPGVWPAVAERLSANTAATELPLRLLLGSLLQRRGQLDPADLARCGLAARRLLDHHWTLPPAATTRFAIEAVIATADSDPAATEALLRRALQSEQMTGRAYNDLRWLTQGVPQLVGTVPGLVEELYVVAMAYEETSTEPTPLPLGRILPMSSTRRQDVDGARLDLVRHYATFLERSPHAAVAALARLIGGEDGDARIFQAIVQGSSVSIARDGSHVWDCRDLANGHDTLSLLNTFEDHLADHAREPLMAAVFDALAAEPRPAAVWRRVLAAGARNPLVADRLLPLDETFTQLLDLDLEDPLAQLIAARYPERPVAERARLETAITALKPEPGDDGSLEWSRADRRYRGFLYALDPAAIVNPDVAAELAATTPPPPRLPHVIGAGEPYPGAERNEGALHNDVDRAIWPLVEPVKQFTDSHLNDVPSLEAVEHSLSEVLGLREALNTRDVSPESRELADTAVAGAVERWTRRTDLPAEALTVASTVLLDLRSHPLPTPTADADAETGGITFIPSGPRSDVARGLLQLVRHPGTYQPQILAAIQALAEDPVMWVRYSIARGLPLLRQADPDSMWTLLRRIADHDTSDHVLYGAVRSAWALRDDLGQAVDVISDVAARVTPTEQRGSAFEACTEAAGLLWVLNGHPAAHALLERLTDLQYGADALAALLHEIRSAGTLTTDDDAIRGRAVDLCQLLTNVGAAAVGDLNAIGPHLTEQEKNRISDGIKLLDAVATQLYYASGAFDASQGPDGTAPTPAQVRLFDETSQMVVQLGSAPVAQITHHLIEMLGHTLDERPKATLLTVRDIILTGGQAGGYQEDKLALDTTASLVRRILADHRGILQAPECLTALREILDIFVDAGWPDAHRLAFGLEHIFR